MPTRYEKGFRPRPSMPVSIDLAPWNFAFDDHILKSTMIKSRFLFVAMAASLTGSAVAKPAAALFERAACNRNNCLRQVCIAIRLEGGVSPLIPLTLST